MFPSLRQYFAPPKPTTRRSRARRPNAELLEGRQLLSIGGELPVNATTRNFQDDSDNASSPTNGMSVVVWTDTYSSADRDIRAQLYNANGSKRGGEIVVSFSGLNEGSPAVAMDGYGGFVVTWTQYVGSDSNIMGRRFDSSGTPLAPSFVVANSSRGEFESDVAMQTNGFFAVSYTYSYSATDLDIHVRRYNNFGNYLGTTFVATSGKNETRSSIAMAADASFAVAYQLQYSTTDDDIYVNRYTAAGGLRGSHAVQTSTTLDRAPSLSMDIFGNAVVAYQRFLNGSWDIKARRLSNTGVLGAEINIRSTADGETNPSVALGPNGRFVVAYDSPVGVQVTEVTGSDAISAHHYAGVSRFGPAVSVTDGGYYFVTYTSVDGGTDLNIRGRYGLLGA